MQFRLGRPAGVKVDLDKLIESRLLIQANSGGGKSWAIRRLLEQTHGHTMQLVVDVEDEFHTLRERYDYILAGRHGGDCPAEPKSAGLLARRLLELGHSAILGIYELKAHERIRFVRNFLEALVGAPRALWRPALVVVDEAHLFCPQSRESEAAGAVIDLMTRGRKRGLCGVLATQRISKLHKDAAAEANCKLIGRSALDVDMRRAAEELGLAGKAEQRRLRSLKPGHFYAFGPAIADEVTEVQVGPVKTTHPTIGQRATPPAPPPERVRKVLSQLADLPSEAEQEERTAADLRRQVAELERELKAAKRAAPPPAPPAPAIAPEVAEAVQQAIGAAERELRKAGEAIARAARGEANAQRKVTRPQREPGAPARTARAPTAPSANGLGKGPQALLAALASLGPRSASKAQIAILAGYKPRSSTVRNYLSMLRAQGYLIGVGDTLTITPEGVAAAGPVEPPRTTEELLELWCPRLGTGPATILRLAVNAYPETLTKADIEAATGYSATSSTMRNYLSTLRTCGLIERRGDCRASDHLFGG